MNPGNTAGSGSRKRRTVLTTLAAAGVVGGVAAVAWVIVGSPEQSVTVPVGPTAIASSSTSASPSASPSTQTTSASATTSTTTGPASAATATATATTTVTATATTSTSGPASTAATVSAQPSTTATSGAPSLTTTSSAPSLTAVPTVPAPTAIPAGLRLPHEGAGPEDDLSSWDERPWDLQTCVARAASYPGVSASDERTIEAAGPNLSRTESLVVAPDLTAARDVVQEVASAMAPCPGSSDDGQTTATQTAVQGSWDDAVLYSMAYERGEAAGIVADSLYVLVARTGNAVVVTTLGGSAALPPRADGTNPNVLATLRQAPDELAPQLCEFRGAGC